MTIKQLDNQLTFLLKKFLKERGHYSSGRLYKSINFKVSDSASLGLKIMLDSLPYINYLEDGKLLDNFFKQSNVIDLIFEYGLSNISGIIDNIEI